MVPDTIEYLVVIRPEFLLQHHDPLGNLDLDLLEQEFKEYENRAAHPPQNWYCRAHHNYSSFVPRFNFEV